MYQIPKKKDFIRKEVSTKRTIKAIMTNEVKHARSMMIDFTLLALTTINSYVECIIGEHSIGLNREGGVISLIHVSCLSPFTRRKPYLL